MEKTDLNPHELFESEKIFRCRCVHFFLKVYKLLQCNLKYHLFFKMSSGRDSVALSGFLKFYHAYNLLHWNNNI